MIVPKPSRGVLYQVRVTESRAVVVDEGKFVGLQNVRVRMGLDFGVHFSKLSFEIMGKTLVHSSRGVLGNVDSLREGEGAEARYIVYVTHAADIEIN